MYSNSGASSRIEMRPQKMRSGSGCWGGGVIMFHQVSSSSGDLHRSVEAAYIGRTFPVGGKGAVLSEGPRGKLQRQRG